MTRIQANPVARAMDPWGILVVNREEWQGDSKLAKRWGSVYLCEGKCRNTYAYPFILFFFFFSGEWINEWAITIHKKNNCFAKLGKKKPLSTQRPLCASKQATRIHPPIWESRHMNQLRDFTSLVLVLFVRHLHMIDLSPPKKTPGNHTIWYPMFLDHLFFTNSPIYPEKTPCQKGSVSQVFSHLRWGESQARHSEKKGFQTNGPCGGKTHELLQAISSRYGSTRQRNEPKLGVLGTFFFLGKRSVFWRKPLVILTSSWTQCRFF